MTSKSEGLERNAIGLTEVLFQSITFMAPAVAVALSIGFATTFALGITPLAVLLALIAVLFTAFSMGREHGLDPVRAYVLCSVAVDLRISEIVDMPNLIVTAHCPLGIFD
jgi:hypothetical protein